MQTSSPTASVGDAGLKLARSESHHYAVTLASGHQHRTHGPIMIESGCLAILEPDGNGILYRELVRQVLAPGYWVYINVVEGSAT